MTALIVDPRSNLNIDTVTEIMRDVAEEAVVPRWRNLASDQMMVKEDMSIVTVADLEAEALIAPRLLEILPGSCVIGEETVAKNPALLSALRGETPVWIVDPIDGTGAFSRGEDNFGMLVSLNMLGRTVAAWAYFPIRGTIIACEQGSGVHIDGSPAEPDLTRQSVMDLIGRYNTKKLAPCLRLVTTAVIAGHPRMVMDTHSSWEFYRLLAGEPGLYLNAHTTPWDTSGGHLMATEAGCGVRYIDGSPYKNTDLGGALLYTQEKSQWWTIRDALFPGHHGPVLPSFRP